MAARKQRFKGTPGEDTQFHNFSVTFEQQKRWAETP